jgi:hypothetical protein
VDCLSFSSQYGIVGSATQNFVLCLIEDFKAARKCFLLNKFECTHVLVRFSVSLTCEISKPF